MSLTHSVNGTNVVGIINENSVSVVLHKMKIFIKMRMDSILGKTISLYLYDKVFAM